LVSLCDLPDTLLYGEILSEHLSFRVRELLQDRFIDLRLPTVRELKWLPALLLEPLSDLLTGARVELHPLYAGELMPSLLHFVEARLPSGLLPVPGMGSEGVNPPEPCGPLKRLRLDALIAPREGP
jgi:hypothetical protein